ncbi:TonB-dependent receptor [Sphingomonas sp. BAUL-RG-20F-R05-02]|uniref:TonB-dependent receptor n=1 Tax=Sphingomonas sp. BAUL-RG-20F-R05-02 TaxID=2914830 RepID=UPI001F5AFD97|nr:TonB-dependent receptor [Sphingomonas sp. BAUL-RG-20F-R05-02]
MRKSIHGLLCAGAVGALFPAALHAQGVPGTPPAAQASPEAIPGSPESAPAAQEPASEGLADIVVTAQRREERLQNVPVAVTAFGAAALETRQIGDITSLAANVPAVTFTATPYGSNDLILAIRGVSPGGVLPNVDPAVGVYVDGVYYARSQGSNFALVDLASVEVLRGPQGTLFGRNTIAGALNITTAKPKYMTEGSIKLAYGNYDALGVTAVANVPIVDDKLAARVVYVHAQHDGYGYDRTTRDRVADQNDDYVRASLRADLADDLRVDLSADYYDGKNHQPLWVLNYFDAALSPANLSPYVVPHGSRITYGGINPLNHSKIYDLSGTITGKIGDVTYKSITAYRHLAFEGASDLDATPIANADVGIFTLDGHQVSQELQLLGNAFGDKLAWVTGAYYFREQMHNSPITHVGAAIQDNTINPDNESMSVFAQLTYELLPRFRLTGGLRYVHDAREMFYTPARYAVGASYALVASPPASAITPAACPFTAIGLNQAPGGCAYRPPPVTFNYVPFTVGVDYRLPTDGLLYAKYAKGFRSGGFQQASGTTAAFYTPFGAEQVSSWEAGAKIGLFAKRLRLGVAGYYSTYSDIQQNAVLQAQPIIITTINAGKAEIYGGEFEAEALLGRLRLNGSLGLIHPKFTGGPFVGSQVPTVAKTTFSLGGDLPIAVGDSGTVKLHLDYTHQSKVYFLNTARVTATGTVPYSDFQIASVTQRGYGLLNAQIAFDLKALPVTIAIYGKNLTDEYYAGRSGSFYGANYNSSVIGAPRTFGVSGTYRL